MENAINEDPISTLFNDVSDDYHENILVGLEEMEESV
jgi:hypothetical protein